jgi:hypothetical protein
VPRDRLRDEETAAEVRFKNEIPIVPRNIQRRFADIAACIVNQDVDSPERSICGGNHFRDALVIANVEIEGYETSAKCGDLILKRLK